MNKTSIEWTDYTSNLIRYRDPEGRSVHGCTKVSAGCANCYASAWSARGLTGERGGTFTAKRQATLTPYFDDGEARRILRRVSGARVFVGDMTDVFGEWVPDALLDQMFAVFGLRPDLTFQVLTKRPERMREYMVDPDRYTCVDEAAAAISGESGVGVITRWPLPNVWLGTSVENQATADERIPHLLETPAAVRFLSCEPLLDSVNLTPAAIPRVWGDLERRFGKPMVDWVIVGGESGPGARPCDVGWIRDIVQQCKAAAVPVFVKQLGSRPVGTKAEAQGGWESSQFADPDARYERHLRDRAGRDMSEWPEDLRVREYPS